MIALRLFPLFDCTFERFPSFLHVLFSESLLEGSFTAGALFIVFFVFFANIDWFNHFRDAREDFMDEGEESPRAFPGPR